MLSLRSGWQHCGWEGSTERMVGCVKNCANEDVGSNEDVLPEPATRTMGQRLQNNNQVSAFPIYNSNNSFQATTTTLGVRTG